MASTNANRLAQRAASTRPRSRLSHPVEGVCSGASVMIASRAVEAASLRKPAQTSGWEKNPENTCSESAVACAARAAWLAGIEISTTFTFL